LTEIRQRKSGVVFLAGQGICIAIVVGMLVAWIRLPVHFEAAGRAAKPSQVTVLAGPPGDHNDVRLVQSPALFSLPSRDGFSSPLHHPSMQVSQPPSAPPAALYLTPPPEFPRRSFGLTGKTLDEMVVLPGENTMMPLTTDPVVFHQTSHDAAGYQVYWQEKPGQPIVGLDVAEPETRESTTPWQAVYFICFDAAGFVDRLLAEVPPPDDALNEAWIRRLRAWQSPEPEPDGSCRRIVVSYRPSAGKARK